MCVYDIHIEIESEIKREKVEQEEAGQGTSESAEMHLMLIVFPFASLAVYFAARPCSARRNAAPPRERISHIYIIIVTRYSTTMKIYQVCRYIYTFSRLYILRITRKFDNLE